MISLVLSRFEKVVGLERDLVGKFLGRYIGLGCIPRYRKILNDELFDLGISRCTVQFVKKQAYESRRTW